jgi:hypothetical protein
VLPSKDWVKTAIAKCMFCDLYVHPCTLRDGCPKIADLGSSKIFSMNVKEKYESKKR